jgi:hypothetical protein
MNAPPPGYNPGESILQGGNATIQPMMGGGEHGDPEQSLLSGGNSANIIPLRGGRRMVKGSRKTYPVRAKVVTTLPPSVAKAMKALGIHLGGQKKKV